MPTLKEWGKRIGSAPTLKQKWELVGQMERSLRKSKVKDWVARASATFEKEYEAALKSRDPERAARALRASVEDAPRNYPKEAVDVHIKLARLFEIAGEYRALRQNPKLFEMVAQGDEFDKKEKARADEVAALAPLGEENPEFVKAVDKFVRDFQEFTRSLDAEHSAKAVRERMGLLGGTIDELLKKIPADQPMAVQAVWTEALLLYKEVIRSLLPLLDFLQGMEEFVSVLEKDLTLKK